MKFKHFETNLKKEKEYPKLVRDRIPEIMRKRGRVVKARILDSEEFQVYLLKKIGEEGSELASVKEKKHLAEELADLIELIETIMEHNGLDTEAIKKVQKEKAEVRGGFKKRILMLEEAK